MNKHQSFVSIVIPCRNEEETITLLLQALLKQRYPKDQLEILIADGMSEDRTRERIYEFSRSHPALNLRVIDNPKQTIPAALNQAISAAAGKFIIRLDAHSVPAEDYIEKCIEILEATGAVNVGGIWDIRPASSTWMARSIANAASHPIGAGDASYRIGGRAGPVDTVPFGAFQREWIEKVGPFNEHLLTNEDYEYNVRILALGGVIWFDPQIRSIYFARSTFAELAKQYYRYGFWKFKMLRRFPKTIRWRQLIPPIFVLTSLLLIVLGLFFNEALTLLLIQWAIYLGVLLGSGFSTAYRAKDLSRSWGVPIALMIMHFSWGIGFLVSFGRDILGADHDK
jgi:glycosyltransferase involved in cell wall biosynthesis